MTDYIIQYWDDKLKDYDDYDDISEIVKKLGPYEIWLLFNYNFDKSGTDFNGTPKDERYCIEIDEYKVPKFKIV